MHDVLEELMRDSFDLARNVLEREGLVTGRADGSLRYDTAALTALAVAFFQVLAASAKLRAERVPPENLLRVR